MYKQGLKLCMVFIIVVTMIGCDSGGSSNPNSGEVGKAGSMARFAIVGDYLYAINGASMQLFDISVPADPAPYANVYVDWGVETIFSYQTSLFIGSQFGVYIYDNTDPSNPVLSSEFTHARACDPVVVNGDYAYITLREGTSCLNGVNQMNILNVSDINAPYQVNSYVMQNPKGLGIDQNRLFVCDGLAGLKTYSLDDPVEPQLVDTRTEIDCYDLIASNGLLVISDDTGILQYGYNQTDLELTPRGSILIGGL